MKALILQQIKIATIKLAKAKNEYYYNLALEDISDLKAELNIWE